MKVETELTVQQINSNIQHARNLHIYTNVLIDHRYWGQQTVHSRSSLSIESTTQKQSQHHELAGLTNFSWVAWAFFKIHVYLMVPFSKPLLQVVS